MIQFKNILVNIKNPPLKPILDAEILKVEIQLNIIFPSEYKEAARAFGAGEFSIIFLRIFTPEQIMNIWTHESSDRLAEFWFWEGSPEILTQEKAIECIPFFGHGGGDSILFHPSDPNMWFILPHGEEQIITVQNFEELITYYVEREIVDGDFLMLEALEFNIW